MNPLASIIAAFAALKLDMTTRFNAAIAKMPPIEQIESGNVALSMLRELDWGKERLERLGSELESTLTAAAATIEGFQHKSGESVDIAAARLFEVLAANAGAAAIQSAIAAKTHLPFDDHKTALESAVLAAKSEAKTEAETDFNARISDIQTITERRNAAIAKVGIVAAAGLKDADLLAENHAELLAVIEQRVEKLAAAGITPDAKPKNFGSLMACTTDEAGAQEFDSRLEMITESAAPLANGEAPISASTSPKPTTPSGTLPGKSEDRKKTVI